MRLTLLWSQSTTGDYFEEENALSIGFHFRNSGQRQARLLDVLNWCTLNNKTTTLYATSVCPKRKTERLKLWC